MALLGWGEGLVNWVENDYDSESPYVLRNVVSVSGRMSKPYPHRGQTIRRCFALMRNSRLQAQVSPLCIQGEFFLALSKLQISLAKKNLSSKWMSETLLDYKESRPCPLNTHYDHHETREFVLTLLHCFSPPSRGLMRGSKDSRWCLVIFSLCSRELTNRRSVDESLL